MDLALEGKVEEGTVEEGTKALGFRHDLWRVPVSLFPNLSGMKDVRDIHDIGTLDTIGE